MDIKEKPSTTEWAPIAKEGNPKKAGEYIVTAKADHDDYRVFRVW